MAIAALLFTSIIWGATIPITKFTLESTPPFTLAFYRFLIAAIIAASLGQFKGLRLRDYAQIGIFSLFGVTLSTGLFLLGLANSEAIDAGLILALSPIVFSLFGVFFLREKINLVHKIGMMLAFSGVTLYLFGPGIFTGQTRFNLLADVLIIISQLSAAIYTIGTKNLFKVYKPAQVTAVSFLIGVFSFFPASVFDYYKNPGWINNLNPLTVVAIVFLGIFASFIAYTLVEWGLSKTTVYLESVMSYLIPFISVLAAVIFLREKLSLLFLTSSIIVTLGIYLTSSNRQFHHHKL